jgi:hypothetical protein
VRFQAQNLFPGRVKLDEVRLRQTCSGLMLRDPACCLSCTPPPVTAWCYSPDVEDNDPRNPFKHPAISCFSLGTEAFTNTIGSMSHDPSQSSDGNGGSLRVAGDPGVTGQDIFAINVAFGDLGAYDRISFKVMNTSLVGFTFQLWDQTGNPLSGTFSVPVVPMGSWTYFDIPLSGPLATANRLRIVNLTTGPNGSEFRLDELRLHHACGNVWVRDPNCCPAAPTATPTDCPGGSVAVTSENDWFTFTGHEADGGQFLDGADAARGFWEVEDGPGTGVITKVTAYVKWRGIKTLGGNILEFDYSVDGPRSTPSSSCSATPPRAPRSGTRWIGSISSWNGPIAGP